MGPRHDLSVCAFTTACLASNYESLCVPTFICGFCMRNSDFWTRNTRLYGYQTSPVVLCTQNGVISTRKTSLYGFQPWSVVLCIQNCDFNTRIACLYGCQTSPAWKTVCLASESLVSMSSSPHLSFLDAKQRLFEQNNMSLWVTDITCRFVHATHHD